jgi:hypothetical protein
LVFSILCLVYFWSKNYEIFSILQYKKELFIK